MSNGANNPPQSAVNILNDMDNTRTTGEPDSVPWSPLRRWTLGALSAVIILALIAFVPGPILRNLDIKNAHQLVDEVATGRAELLAKQNEIHSPLTNLGDPVRSWTQVSCWLQPRYSDGDGEQDIIMFYWQECALVAYEIYPLPTDVGSAAEAAASLGGRTLGVTTCNETLYEVLSPEVFDSGTDEYATFLQWMNPEGEPPPDQPERCTLPTPDDPDTAHVNSDIDEPLTANSYVVYEVRSPVSATDVGCEQPITWMGPCTGEPKGFPTLSPNEETSRT